MQRKTTKSARLTFRLPATIHQDHRNRYHPLVHIVGSSRKRGRTAAEVEQRSVRSSGLEFYERLRSEWSNRIRHISLRNSEASEPRSSRLAT
jgi:hypothetical protein